MKSLDLKAVVQRMNIIEELEEKKRREELRKEKEKEDSEKIIQYITTLNMSAR